MTELPPELKKAEKTSDEITDELTRLEDSEVTTFGESENSPRMRAIDKAKEDFVFKSWLPSSVVASEWDKREKEFASFLEEAKLQLKWKGTICAFHSDCLHITKNDILVVLEGKRND